MSDILSYQNKKQTTTKRNSDSDLKYVFFGVFILYSANFFLLDYLSYSVEDRYWQGKLGGVTEKATLLKKIIRDILHHQLTVFINIVALS